MTPEELDKLKVLAANLNDLMRAPEPTSRPWNNAVRVAIQCIADYEE